MSNTKKMRSVYSRDEWQTPEYLNAVKAIRELAEADNGPALARVALADGLNPWQPDGIKPGLTRYMKENDLAISGGRRCVQRLRGKQCGYGRRSFACECDPPGADHSVLFVKDGRPYSYVYQPYHFRTEDIIALAEFCQRTGLQAEFDIFADWHYPANILSIVITASKPGGVNGS